MPADSRAIASDRAGCVVSGEPWKFLELLAVNVVSAQNLVGCAGSLEEECVEGSTGDGGLAW